MSLILFNVFVEKVSFEISQNTTFFCCRYAVISDFECISFFKNGLLSKNFFPKKLTQKIDGQSGSEHTHSSSSLILARPSRENRLLNQY